jgi:hypothetical protein
VIAAAANHSTSSTAGCHPSRRGERLRSPAEPPAPFADTATTLSLLMRETLRYFMWAFQQHFRSSLQSETERLLETIGLDVKPRALLVGFAAAEEATWRKR